MYVAVRDIFIPFSRRFEGWECCMYSDVLGLVTTGMGNKIDDSNESSNMSQLVAAAPALKLPWIDVKTGQAADQVAVFAEWQRVKAAGGNRPLNYWPETQQLTLSDADVEVLVFAEVEAFERQLRAVPEFTAYDTWPADAQLGVLSMVWAMGVGGLQKFPMFRAACKFRLFSYAAAQCKMNEVGNPGLKPRNIDNATLFNNAATVLKQGLPLDKLLFALPEPKVEA